MKETEKTKIIEPIRYVQDSDLSVFNLGKVPAFSISTDRMSSNDYFNLLNEFKDNGLLALPRNEGGYIAGFIFSNNQLELVKKTPNYSIGIPVTSDYSTLIQYKNNANFANIGCSAIFAAFRGFGINGECNRCFSLTKSTSHSDVISVKNTALRERKIEELVIEENYFEIPYKFFKKINKEDVSIDVINSGVSIKIDVNGSTEGVLGYKDGLERQKKYALFTLNLEEFIKKRMGEDALIGENHGESLVVYIKNPLNVLKISKAIKLLMSDENYNFTAKLVGKRIFDIELYSYNGNVIFSTNPIKEKVWQSIETIHKEKKYPAHRIVFSK